MHSVTPSHSLKNKQRLRRGINVFLPIALLVAVILLILMYRNASTLVNNSIHHQLQEISDRSQSRLDSYLSGLDTLLSNTADNPSLANSLLKDDRKTAKKLLQNSLHHSYGEYLDLLILTKQDKYWANMNSPLYLLEHSLSSLISNTPYYNKWSSVELNPPTPLIAIIQRYPILSLHTGQVTGSLFGGLILNDNLTLLSLLGEGIQDTNLQLVLKGEPVGPTLINTDVPDHVLRYALSSNKKTGQTSGHYFKTQPLFINGEPSELSLLLITDDSAFKRLQKNNAYHIALAIILIIFTIFSILIYRTNEVDINQEK